MRKITELGPRSRRRGRGLRADRGPRPEPGRGRPDDGAHQGPLLRRVRGARARHAGRGQAHGRLPAAGIHRRSGSPRATPTAPTSRTSPWSAITLDDAAISFEVGGKTLTPEVLNDFVAVSRHEQAAGGGEGQRRRVRRLRRRRAPEYGWDDFKGVDVRGKTVVMLINDPPVPRPEGPDEARRRHVQGEGDDLLRALDLQVRGGLREGRRRLPHRPRDRARGLPLRRRRRRAGAARTSR